MTPRSSRLGGFPARVPGRHAPLLFVHGGYTHAACWTRHFIPYFQARGFDCHALDLSGHGASEGRDHLDAYSLEDYTMDVADAVAALAKLPVLIGHSMGALLVQRHLERGRAAGLALLAPVPPSGTAGSAMRLAFTSPDFFSALSEVLGPAPSDHALEVLARIYFSPAMERRAVAALLPLVQPESRRAVMEMLTPDFWGAHARPALPAIVMGGSEDAVFPASLLRFSASPWHARLEVVPGAGHMLMLDPQWEDAAERLHAWLGRLDAPASHTPPP